MNCSPLLFSIFLVSFLSSCSLNDDIETISKNEETIEISGGPFDFIIDDNPDFVSGLSVSNDIPSFGSQVAWTITESNGNILSIHSTKDDLESTDFDEAGGGNCLIWWLRYTPGLQGFSVDNNINTDLQGTFGLSNSIVVNRTIPPTANE